MSRVILGGSRNLRFTGTGRNRGLGYPTPQDVVEDYVLLSPITVGVLGTEATVTSE
jgi:hypothetical protein